MKVCSIAYLPSESDKRFGTLDFIDNLAANRPAGDLILFSDAPQPTAEKAGFTVLRLQKSVDAIPSLQNARIQRPGTAEMVENRAAINNLLFITAIRICEKQGYTHFLYLESDCRVKNHLDGEPPLKYRGEDESVGGGFKRIAWDTRIFREFFDHPRHLLMAGSVVAYNPYNHTLATAERFERFLAESKAAGRRNVIPVYGWLSASSGQGCNYFVNGAGAVYSVAGMKLLMPELAENNDIGLAAKIWAFDFDLGLRLWQRFEADGLDLIGYLPSVYSGYGNVLNTKADRLRMLDEWAACVHQVKGDQ